MAFEETNSGSPDSNVSAVLDALQHAGLLATEQRDHLGEVLKTTQVSLDQVLCNLGLVTEEALSEFYADYFGIPRLDKAVMAPLVVEVQKTNRNFLDQHRIAPITRGDGFIGAAIVDPMDQHAIAGLVFALGIQIRPVLVTTSAFERMMALIEPEIIDTPGNIEESEISGDAAKLKDLASGEPAVKLLNRLIIDASHGRASDIHIEPKERSVDIRYRIDGVLGAHETLTKTQGLAIISRLKILASLDIAERRRPQDGRFSFSIEGRSIDLRVSTAPTIFGESVVLRLLEKTTASLDLDALGFSSTHSDKLKRLINQPNGIILITGPTGSGKTTTLYALLNMLAEGESKILTIEDPVEYQIDGISQTQVNPAIGLDFANAMRSFLRHDPDVIMVGEMRDLETARTAVQASLTGHLVLSTLHTNDAPSAITRLLDMGVEDYLVASSLIGVVAQRLVRTTCPACTSGTGDRTTCLACHSTGYCGRVAICEVLEVDEALKSAIKKGATASVLRDAAKKSGFTPLADDGRRKIQSGLTSESEIKRVLGI